MSVSVSLARPKSRIFTSPSSVTMMLAGFRSRWTMPAAWARPSASAICAAKSSVLRDGQPLPSDQLAERPASHELHHDEVHAVGAA